MLTSKEWGLAGRPSSYNFLLGYEGEIAVGQELNQLRGVGDGHTI